MDGDERLRRKNEFDASLVYGTRKFNILTGRDLYAEYRKRTDDAWKDPEGDKLYDAFVEYRNCPLCGANDNTAVFQKSGFPHVLCNICDLLYVNPVLKPEVHLNVYDKEGLYERVLESKEQLEMNRLEFKYYLDVVKMYLDKEENIKICDIGCGPGDLLGEAKKRGFYVLGIEPHKASHKALTEKGIDYVADYFPLKEKLDMKFNCVFVLNTLEHVNNLSEFLSYISMILESKGLLYISTPNVNAMINRVLHEKAGAFGGHTHLQLFKKDTLCLLMEKNGFEVLECETVITELGAIKNYLSFKDPYFGDNRDEDVLEFLTPSVIYKHHLGRSLNVVSRLKM